VWLGATLRRRNGLCGDEQGKGEDHGAWDGRRGVRLLQG
jgi:hypothetical protein